MTSNYDYKDIEKFGNETYEWYKGMQLKERLLLGKILELFLEAVTPLQEPTKDTDYRKLALLTIATRLFNDAEGANHLLLRGLPTQAQMIIRNIIEATMLFRLFLAKPELAKKWIDGLSEYQPGTVNSMLQEIGVNAGEYALYGLFSQEGHANFLSSLPNLQEEGVEEGMKRTFHFGSSRLPSTMFFVQHSFLNLFFLLHILLVEPMSEYYSQHSDKVVYMTWANKVNDLIPELEDLTMEGAKGSGTDKHEVDKRITELIEKKFRLKKFKKRLSGNNDVPTKIE